MSEESCVGLLESWKFLLDYASTSDLRNHGLNVEEEMEIVRKILRSAVGELETYDKYLDAVYEEYSETRVGRPFYRKGPIPVHCR